MDEQKKSNPAIKISVIVLVLVVAYFGYFKYSQKQQAISSPQNPVEVPATQNPSDNTSANPLSYKDGTYEASGTYQVPSGVESLSVKLVIKNDVVADATVINTAIKPESKNYQNKFISGYKSYVVGKKISDISVTKISGSSLTPKGFMDALLKIKTEAKA